MQEVVQRFKKCSEVTDVQPRYPHDIGLVRRGSDRPVPAVSIDPAEHRGAGEWLARGGEDAHAEWRVVEGEGGRVAMLRLSRPAGDLEVILAFDRDDRVEREAVSAAARAGRLAVCATERFARFVDDGETEGVAYVPVRRRDLHDFLTP